MPVRFRRRSRPLLVDASFLNRCWRCSSSALIFGDTDGPASGGGVGALVSELAWSTCFGVELDDLTRLE